MHSSYNNRIENKAFNKRALFALLRSLSKFDRVGSIPANAGVFNLIFKEKLKKNRLKSYNSSANFWINKFLRGFSSHGQNRNHVKLFSRVNRSFRGKKWRGNILTQEMQLTCF